MRTIFVKSDDGPNVLLFADHILFVAALSSETCKVFFSDSSIEIGCPIEAVSNAIASFNDGSLTEGITSRPDEPRV